MLDKNPAPKNAGECRLEVLGLLVEAYDEIHYPMPRKSTPQSIVAFMLDQQGKTRADLVPILGSKSRVSEFLAGKRRLSLAQISALLATQREFYTRLSRLLDAHVTAMVAAQGGKQKRRKR